MVKLYYVLTYIWTESAVEYHLKQVSGEIALENLFQLHPNAFSRNPLESVTIFLDCLDCHSIMSIWLFCYAAIKPKTRHQNKTNLK